MTWGYQSYDSSFNDNTLKEAFIAAANKGLNFWDSAGTSKYLQSCN